MEPIAEHELANGNSNISVRQGYISKAHFPPTLPPSNSKINPYAPRLARYKITERM
jgi:hypothetical protein